MNNTSIQHQNEDASTELTIEMSPELVVLKANIDAMNELAEKYEKERREKSCQYCGIIEKRPGCGQGIAMALCPFCRLSFPFMPVIEVSAIPLITGQIAARGSQNFKQAVFTFYHDLSSYYEFFDADRRQNEIHAELLMPQSLRHYMNGRDWSVPSQRDFEEAAVNSFVSRKMLKPIEPVYSFLSALMSDEHEHEDLLRLVHNTLVAPVWAAWAASPELWVKMENIARQEAKIQKAKVNRWN